jgi:hypothetical protein
MTAPLDKLHDFYQPPLPSWRPQTAGWYVVFAIVGLLLIWTAVHFYRRWRANRYRREALRELGRVEITGLSALLKRTALSAWPREEVASLSGTEWLRFLDSSMLLPVFENAPANRIEELAFSHTKPSPDDEAALRNASAEWIKQHKPPRRTKTPQSGAPHVSA